MALMVIINSDKGKTQDSVLRLNDERRSCKVNPLFINELIFSTHIYYFSSMTKSFNYLTLCISDVRQQVRRPAPTRR